MPFAPHGHEAAAARCRQLAADIDWSETLLTQWPVPIAHEYWRLREELAAGRTLDAMWQLKDLAEVLVKLPVLIAARLLIEAGKPADARSARALLLAPSGPTLGRWLSQDVNEPGGAALINRALALPASAAWLPVLSLLIDARGQSTTLYAALSDLVGWRNRELGHGALRFDHQRYPDEFEQRLRRLLGALHARAGVWQGLTLAVTGSADATLTGADALDAGAPARAGLGERALRALELRSATACLRLGPYVSLRQPAGQTPGCYLLNKRVTDRQKSAASPRHRLHLLDYTSGEADVTTADEAGSDAALQDEFASLAGQPLAASADLFDHPARELLEQLALASEYLPPDYLRDAVRAFIDHPARDRGIFWLSGPPNVGKTLFAAGLATHGKLWQMLDLTGPQPLLDELATLVVLIRRAYRTSVVTLSHEVIGSLGRVPEGRHVELSALVEIAKTSGEYGGTAPGAFCEWLTRLLALSKHPRLLLVIDCLDELRARDEHHEGGHLTDLLPAAQQLPANVYLLLTSRELHPNLREEECPGYVIEALERLRATSEPTLFEQYALDPLTNPGYAALLERYFRDQTARLGWPQATTQVACAQTLEAAEHRFGLFAYLTTLLTQQLLAPADLADLGPRPLAAHLQALKDHEPQKQYRLIRRILLHLAAAESAHLAEVRLMEPAPVIDRDWLGLDLLELAERCDYPADSLSSLDPRFVTALHAISGLLRSYRGGTGTGSHIALGLRRMLEQLRALPGWDCGEELRQVFADTLQRARTAEDDDARVAALVALAGPAAALAERQAAVSGLETEFVEHIRSLAEQIAEQRSDTTTAIRLSVCAEVLCRCAQLAAGDATGRHIWQQQGAQSRDLLGIQRCTRQQLVTAITDYDAAVADLEELTAPGRDCPPAWRNDLAAVLVNRGIAKQDAPGYGAGAAIVDCDRAIEIREALVQALGRDCPLAWFNGLAGALMNRGNVKQHAPGHGAGAAIADYDRAIEIREALVQALGRDCPPAWSNDLAAVLVNRGIAKQDAPGHSDGAAIADYDRAIDILDALVQASGRDCPPTWHNDLATAYLNRGTAKQHAPGHGASAALSDYDRAIDLLDAMMQSLGSDCPLGLRSTLAMALVNCGNAKQAAPGHGAGAAITDYDRAIEIREALVQDPSHDCPPAWRNDLAVALMNRGAAKQDAPGHGADAAIVDCDRAIEIREALVQSLGSDCPLAWRSDLAKALEWLGFAKQYHPGHGANAAIAEYDRGIEIREALVQALGSDCPPAWRNDLASVLMNRGIAKSTSLGPMAGLGDIETAIAELEALIVSAGAASSLDWHETLEKARHNRSVWLSATGGYAPPSLTLPHGIRITQPDRPASPTTRAAAAARSTAPTPFAQAPAPPRQPPPAPPDNRLRNADGIALLLAMLLTYPVTQLLWPWLARFARGDKPGVLVQMGVLLGLTGLLVLALRAVVIVRRRLVRQ